MTPDITRDSLDDLEALVRLAGDYVQPSDDLRPRVLEAARVVRHEQQVRRRISRVAAVLLVAAALAAPFYGQWQGDAAAQAALWPLGMDQAPQAADAPGDSGWEMVDSFTELRRYQARLLRLAL
jgi:hypothetical protein